jgi:hypothetical protein
MGMSREAAELEKERIGFEMARRGSDYLGSLKLPYTENQLLTGLHH